MDRTRSRIKFTILTLGCKVNQYESEALEKVLSDKGHTSFDPRWVNGQKLSPQKASDVYIINTCTVTQKAAMQSRQAIRQAVRSNSDALIIVTGCYAQTQAEVIATISGVDCVVGHKEKGRIPDLIFTMSKNNAIPVKILTQDIFSETTYQDMPVTPSGLRSRPFLKIQDGCSACCTYCIVPYARGKSRSMSLSNVLAGIRELKSKGYHEIVLTGIHLGSYGHDLSPQTGLYELLVQIRDLELIHRVRLSSIEPRELSDKIIDLAARWKGLCPHFHIPLQSGDNNILKRMNRPYQRNFFYDLILNIHSRLPHTAIGIDCLIGFPGETQEAFLNTYRLMETLPVSYLHVFPFSPREGTPAWTYSGKIGSMDIKERCHAMRILGREKKKQFYEKFVGKKLEALVEQKRDSSTGLLKAISSNYIPVLIKGPEEWKNSIQSVKVLKVSDTLTVYGSHVHVAVGAEKGTGEAGQIYNQDKKRIRMTNGMN
jgi:threonylcarbamoyladenosine tRNA methylthiotransferase MtaB